MPSRLLAGGMWLVAVQFTERLLGFASIAILARLLTPTDFGVVALAGTVVAAVELLSAFGFDWALVRQRELPPELLNSAWTLRVLLGVVTALFLAAIAPLAARFYRLEAVAPVLVVLGFASFIGSLENIGTIFFRRDFAFHSEFLLRTTTKLIGFVVTTSLAYWLRSYWALIAGVVTLRASSSFLSYMLHPFRPRVTLSRSRELLGFSTWLLIGNVVEYCQQRFSDVYLGRVLGPRATGLFSVGGELARLPVTEVATPVNRVAYSKYSEDMHHGRPIVASYLEIASVIWLIALPMCAGTIAVAPEIVRLVLGPNWADAADVIQLLALGAGFTVLTANTHYVYWALGHSKAVATISAIGALIIIPCTLILGHYWGVRGVAVANALTAGLLVPLNFSWLKRIAGVGLKDLLSRTWRVSLSALFMLLVLSAFNSAAGSGTFGSALAVFALKVVAGAAVYIGAAYALLRMTRPAVGPETTVLNYIRSSLAARFTQ